MKKRNEQIKVNIDVEFDDSQVSLEEIEFIMNFSKLLIEKIIHNPDILNKVKK